MRKGRAATVDFVGSIHVGAMRRVSDKGWQRAVGLSDLHRRQTSSEYLTRRDSNVAGTVARLIPIKGK